LIGVDRKWLAMGQNGAFDPISGRGEIRWF
jgi:hypothetical protein